MPISNTTSPYGQHVVGNAKLLLPVLDAQGFVVPVVDGLVGVSYPFAVVDQPMTIVAGGFTANPTDILQVQVSPEGCTWQDLWIHGTAIQLTPHNSLIHISVPGTYRLVRPGWGVGTPVDPLWACTASGWYGTLTHEPALGLIPKVGSQGPQGLVGVQGPQGDPGGPQGPQGAQGDIGVGTPGTPGAQGPQGGVGAQGAQGGSGIPGATGPQGAVGAQGAQGAAPSGGGGMVLLEQYTANSSPSLDFTSFISSTYDVYKVELSNIRSVANAPALIMQFGWGSPITWDTGNNYNWATRWVDMQSGTGVRAGWSFGGPPTLFYNLAYPATGGIGVASVTLFGLQDATLKKLFHGAMAYSNSGPNLIHETIGGQWLDVTHAVAGVRFIFSTGAILSGTIRIYGVAK
jgi:hypothetical protein